MRAPAARWTEFWVNRATPDPYSNYAWMRGRGAALVRPGADGIPNEWYVTGYDAVKRLLLDPRLGNREIGAPADGYDGDVLSHDGDRHKRLRRIMAPALAGAGLRELEADIQATVAQCIGRAHGGEVCDWVTDVAIPVPAATIGDLLGIPEHLRWDPVELFSAFIASEFSEPADSTAAEALASYVSDVAAAGTGAVLRALRQAGCTAEEVEANTFLLLGAGLTTSVPLLGSIIYRALESRALLRDRNADGESLRAFVEEVARLDGPVQLTVTRYAYAAIELGPEKSIEPGDRVLLVLAAADRDPAAFEQPDALVVGRPTRSLAFGHGPHYCLGAHLARIEGASVLRCLAAIIERADLELREVTWGFGPRLRGPTRLHVSQLAHATTSGRA